MPGLVGAGNRGYGGEVGELSLWCGSWQRFQPALWVDPMLVLVSILCGMLLGRERERREKPAGLRTLALVCMGAAVFTMMSFAFTTTTGDSGRVAAQIVTGIGFLGAGVILHGRRIVSGVTTAAIIWVAAAIGMTVGGGYAVAGIGLSILVNRLMALIFLYNTRWDPDLHHVRVAVEFDPERGLTRVRLERVVADFELGPAEAQWTDVSPSTSRLILSLKLARIHFHELLSDIVDVPGVRAVERERFEPVNPSADNASSSS